MSARSQKDRPLSVESQKDHPFYATEDNREVTATSGFSQLTVVLPKLDPLNFLADDSREDFNDLETMSSPASPTARPISEVAFFCRRQYTAPVSGAGRHHRRALSELERQLTSGRQLLTDRAFELLIGGRCEIPNATARLPDPKKLCRWGKELLRPPTIVDGVCQICYTCTSTMKQPCGNLDCTGQYCTDCLCQTALSMIEASLYACPYLKCPECRNRIPTSVWRRLVPDEAWDQYCTNARALLNFRCPDCDEVGSLLTQRVERSAISAEEHACWIRWGQDMTSVNLVETITKTKMCVAMAPGDAAVLSPNCSAQKRFYYLLSLVDDIERRCTLLLQWLRQYPYFKTPCCEEKMCFKCKTRGWHPGHTCGVCEKRSVAGQLCSGAPSAACQR